MSKFKMHKIRKKKENISYVHIFDAFLCCSIEFPKNEKPKKNYLTASEEPTMT